MSAPITVLVEYQVQSCDADITGHLEVITRTIRHRLINSDHGVMWIPAPDGEARAIVNRVTVAQQTP